MVILALDTATDAATAALVLDGEVLGERRSRAVTILEDCDALLRQGGVHARDLEAMPSLRATRARVFDMFPQTTHFEVMVLLARAPALPVVE